MFEVADLRDKAISYRNRRELVCIDTHLDSKADVIMGGREIFFFWWLLFCQ